ASISAIVSDPPDGTVATVGAALVLAGAFTKSAQAPFHFWLPGAMAAPTPVSAYLHSATMVKAGIVLVARLAPGLAPLGPWRGLIAAAGVTSLLLGGLRAMRQYDAKLLLAHGTVSQLGFLMVLVGAGDPGLTAAGVAMLLTHALFKAALFLVVGIVDHSAHSRDLRALTGLGRRLPLLAALAGLAAASMAGIPPLLGFAAKEMALDEVLHADLGAYDAVVLAGIVLGSVLTAAYSARLVLGLFGSRPVPAPSGARTTEVLAIDPDDVGRPSPAFVAPVVVLVAASLLGGLLAPTVGDWLAPAASSLD